MSQMLLQLHFMVMGTLTKLLFLADIHMPKIHALYYLLKYSGSMFFDKWDYYRFVGSTIWGESPPIFPSIHIPIPSCCIPSGIFLFLSLLLLYPSDVLTCKIECNIPRLCKCHLQRPDIHQHHTECNHQSQ